MTKAASPLEGLRILLVEDEDCIAVELTRALRGLGTVVLGPVGTVEQARSLREQPHDMALLNVDLHGQPTFHLAESLLDQGVPVAFVTGYDGALLPRRLRALPRVDKPVELVALKETMLRVSGRSVPMAT